MWAVLAGQTDWVCHIGNVTLCEEAVAWSYVIVTWWNGSGGIQAWSWRPTGFLQCFDTVDLVIWLVKIIPEMTYNVLSGTLRLCTTTRMPQIVDWQSWLVACISYILQMMKLTWLINYCTLFTRWFRVSAVRAWISLPPHIRDAPSLLAFHLDLKTGLFRLTYPADWQSDIVCSLYCSTAHSNCQLFIADLRDIWHHKVVLQQKCDSVT